jgi:hypothetical protein
VAVVVVAVCNFSMLALSILEYRNPEVKVRPPKMAID